MTLQDRQENRDYFKRFEAAIPGIMSLDSKIPGPTVIVIGATHGNEPAGVNASIRLHRQFINGELTLLKGTIHFVLGNPEAYLENRRCVEFDLNRSFTRREKKCYEAHRAQELQAFMLKNPVDAILLDIHSVSIGDDLFWVYHQDYRPTKVRPDALAHLPLHFVYHDMHIPGLLIEMGIKAGAEAFGMECGNHLSPDASDIATYCVSRLLCLQGMLDANLALPPKLKAQIEKPVVYETLCYIPVRPGFRFTLGEVATGTFIPKGSVYAVADKHDYTAEQDCYLCMPSKTVVETDHDAGFLCHKSSL